MYSSALRDVSQSICSHVTFAYMPPQEQKGQGLSLCVYPEPVDEERDGCEENGVAKSGRGGVCSVPLGLIVEARLNGAGAGKVSAQRGQQRRKYYSCMEGRYLTPHSTLCSEKRGEGGATLTDRETEMQWRLEICGGRGEGEGQRQTKGRRAQSSEEIASGT